MQILFPYSGLLLASLVLTLSLLILLAIKTRNYFNQKEKALAEAQAEINNFKAIALRSELEWKTLFNVAQEGIIIQHEGYVVAANDSFAYMLGIEAFELVDSDILRLLSRDDRVEFVKTLELVRGGVEAKKFQVHLRTVLGDLRVAIVTMRSFEYFGKKCELVFFLEVPAQFKNNEKQKSKEQHFIAISEETEDMVALFDIHCVLQWGNAAWRSFWGVASGRESGVYALFHDKSYAKEELKDALTKVSAGLTVNVLPIQMDSPKGHSRILSMRFVPIFEPDTNGSIQYGFGLIQKDVTKELSLTSKLEAAHEDIKKCNYKIREFIDKQNDIFDSLPTAFIIVSNLGIVTYWNKIAEQKFDILRAHALGQSITILSHYLHDIDQYVSRAFEADSALTITLPNNDIFSISPCNNKRLAVLQISKTF